MDNRDGKRDGWEGRGWAAGRGAEGGRYGASCEPPAAGAADVDVDNWMES